MSLSTGIQWCDDTVNPTMGCDGCELWLPEAGEAGKRCYSGKEHERRAGHPGYAPRFTRVSLFPGRTMEIAHQRDLTGKTRLLKPWLTGLPRLIFVSDMSDALSKGVPFPYLEAEIIVPALSPMGSRHVWLWLTKRPVYMARFCVWLRDRGTEWPANIWAGTSITTSATTRRIAALVRVGNEHTTRFLSVEPQWEAMDIRRSLGRVDWVIQGGESGRGARPFDLAWARAMRDECGHAGVAYFLKQLGRTAMENGRSLRLRDPHGGDWTEWPPDLRVRQFPRSACASQPEGGRR